MMPVLVLDAQSSAIASHDHLGAEDAVAVVDVYELPSLDLDRFAAMLITDMVDQEFLWQQREVIASFLARGRVVVFCGQLLRDWLPGCGTFVPARITAMRDYAVQLVGAHPVFAGVEPRDLTFRRGVAGFFARGHHPPPHGAQVLATLAAGQPTTWIDRTTTLGTVFAHAGNSLLHYAQVDSTAARVAPQLLAWVRDEGSA